MSEDKVYASYVTCLLHKSLADSLNEHFVAGLNAKPELA